jgi:hypothetical protein
MDPDHDAANSGYVIRGSGSASKFLYGTNTENASSYAFPIDSKSFRETTY